MSWGRHSPTWEIYTSKSDRLSGFEPRKPGEKLTASQSEVSHWSLVQGPASQKASESGLARARHLEHI